MQVTLHIKTFLNTKDFNALVELRLRVYDIKIAKKLISTPTNTVRKQLDTAS